MDLTLMKKAAQQLQLSFDDDNAKALMKFADAPDVVLGSPARKMPHLLLTIQIKGRRVTFVVGDTHAIWLAHQKDEMARRVFAALLEHMKKGQSIVVEVVKAQFRSGAPEAAQRLEDLDLDLF